MLDNHLQELEKAVRPPCPGDSFWVTFIDRDDHASRLDDLRRRVKYLAFDVEATRRENQYLREMLEGQGRR